MLLEVRRETKSYIVLTVKMTGGRKADTKKKRQSPVTLGG